MEAEERPTKHRKLNGDNDGHTMAQKSPSPEDRAGTTFPDNGNYPSTEITSAKENDSDSDPADDQTPQGPHSKPIVTNDVSCCDSITAPSKNQMKKLRKKLKWEAGREQRKAIRKQKTQEKKARRRVAGIAASQEGNASKITAATHIQNRSDRASQRPGVPKRVSGKLLPITLVIDCAFDELMHERECISLASQITRAYSDNHRAPYKAHLVLSSWGGELRTRFDTFLHQHYQNWKGVTILEEDFVEAAARSKDRMLDHNGGRLAGALAMENVNLSLTDLQDQSEVIYLTSDSDCTLERLKPYGTYVIGGLVDKNRHKGVCYKSACDRGIKTAKLPIGKYMDMQSRSVLATNHVVEIMLRWLECGDWGEAFLKVIPKRKGGRLKSKPENRGAEGDCDKEETAEKETKTLSNIPKQTEGHTGLEDEEGETSGTCPDHEDAWMDGGPEVSIAPNTTRSSIPEDKGCG